MTLNLVHLGHGETALLESPDFIDPTVTLPKRAPSPQKRAKERWDRIEAEIYALAQEASQRRSYGPVSLLKARHDQCRYIEGDSAGAKCCGKKVSNPGSSWCQVHHEIVFRGGPSLCGKPVNPYWK